MEKKSIEYVLPEEIEKRSFEIIAAELAERGITLPAEQDPVINIERILLVFCRMICRNI